MKIDLHCHTYYSNDALSSPYDVIKEVLKKGLNGIAITDHDTISGWKDAIKAADELNAFVILGEEVKSNEGDILGLFLKEEIKMKGCSPVQIINEIHRQEGLAIIPHPFHKSEGFKGNIRDYLNILDGIEVYNARRPLTYPDKKAFDIAQKNNLIMTAGSDCHIDKACGYAYVECEAKNLNEFKRKLIKRENKIKGKKSPYIYILSPTIKKLRNLF
ncbi:MAG: PHP domain-containing protein [Candidatus Pacebacteria bacterium]|nr:PHP domain-containing protein [Candidatus Paceibacterota bacterium]